MAHTQNNEKSVSAHGPLVEGRKDMFYLTTHSTHCPLVEGRKEMFYLTTHSTHGPLVVPHKP